jgi:hypothetical protein
MKRFTTINFQGRRMHYEFPVITTDGNRMGWSKRVLIMDNEEVVGFQTARDITQLRRGCAGTSRTRR